MRRNLFVSLAPSLAIAAVVLLMGSLAPTMAWADQTFNVSVPGTADIFAAGLAQPPALEPNGGPPGTGGGTLPPSVSFVASTGAVLTVPAVTGEIFFNGPGLTSVPNGNPGFSTDFNPVGPISGIIDSDSCEFLTGVFLVGAQPTGAPPASLNFSSSAIGADYTTLSPQLGQTFFIGSGSTSSGVLRRILAPAGATRLFLGVADGPECQGNPGNYNDNGGAYQASVDLSTPPPPEVFGPSGIVQVPSSKACVSRRSFTVHVRQLPGLVYREVTVDVNGHRVNVTRGRRISAPIDLRGLPRGTYVVKITVLTTKGATVTGTRTYHTCRSHPLHPRGQPTV
jgi:hypothetical protein